MGRVRITFQVLVPALLLVGMVGFWTMNGCAPSVGTSSGPDAPLSGEQLKQAQTLYSQLQRERSLNRDRKCLELAGTLLDYYPNFERNDEVLSIAVGSAQRLGDLQQALTLTDEFLNKFPSSPLLDQRLLQGAEIALATQDTLAAAGFLVRHYDRGPERATRSDGIPSAAPVLESLTADQLNGLMETEHGQPIWGYLGYLQVAKRLEAGAFPEAEAIGDQMVVLGPDNHWLELTREMLAVGGTIAPGFQRPSGPVNVNRVGLLSPLTGRFAILGNAFVDACLLALDKTNSETGRSFELLVEDSAGNPVNSALATRRLSGEEGCMAIFGALMSDPTCTAALVADMYGVPLVSPTATNDRVWQLGERVFQTNLTGLYEVRLLAQLATTVLLKERFAVLYPDDPEGLRNAEVFSAEIEQLGGQVVAMQPFPPQGTDFRNPIEQIKEKRPEVIFSPATVDQMILLGPQLDFFRAGTLVLGLSNWNSQKLIERAGTQLERAVFPSDQALIPPHWTAEFEQVWDGSNYPREATALALRAYQSLRMLLETMATSGAVDRNQLAQALTMRLANRGLETEGPDSFAPVVNMCRTEQIVSFPSYIFKDAWQLTEGTRVDSLVVDGLEMLPAVPDSTGTP